MPNPSPDRREPRFPWWPAFSLICAGSCAVLLLRRAAGPPPPAGRAGGDRRPFPDDAAAHLATSW
ncbi:hypothetical protein C0216_13135 [Streptomyces globosus]|uniref:Uncharacterized protein n=1 Tax=Streptomyces globosus TaxID=68209 RepID=A0A344U054_9ACTN|nr:MULTISPECIES: hypothetical protein [Streptomyces]AXE24275.1 hypothetical protein C0216_13135 [Streptomyces globosus]